MNTVSQPNTSSRYKTGIALLVLSLAASPVVAQEETIALNAVNKAGEVIDAAMDAYGGAETIAALDSLSQKSTFKTWAVNQSRGAEAPWDENAQTNFNAVDFSDSFFYTHNKGTGGGFDFEGATIINGEDSAQINFRSGTWSPIAEPDFNTTSGPFTRVTAPLLMKQLQSRRQTSHWLGTADVNGRPHDVITLVMEVGPALSLYFDEETHMLNRMERVLPPFGVVEYRFLDYQDVDGIPFSQRFELYINGDQNLDIEILETTVNQPVEQFAALPSNLSETAPIVPDDLSLNEIAEGVFLVGGSGTYALFVEMEDHVVAIGGTAGIPDRISELRKEVADKPINFGVLTHHHSDHVPGVAAYVGEGATVVTVEAHEAVVRGASGDSPDLKMEFVESHKTLTDGQRRIELYDIGPTPHTEHLVVAWLPEEGILFEADHFPQPASGVIPPANPVTISLAEALDRLEISPRMIVGAHSANVATPQDLQTALQKGRELAQN